MSVPARNFATFFGGGRPPATSGWSLREEESQMIATGNDADGSLWREESLPMEITAPRNALAEVLVRIATVAERWLESQGKVQEANESVVPMPSVKEWYSPEEAGVEIKRTANHIRELCRKGRFGTKDAGGKWIIHRKELEAFRLGRTKIHGERFP